MQDHALYRSTRCIPTRCGTFFATTTFDAAVDLRDTRIAARNAYQRTPTCATTPPATDVDRHPNYRATLNDERRAGFRRAHNAGPMHQLA
jgi:hypothetical protein